MPTVYKGRILDVNLETAHLPTGRKARLEIIRHPGAAAVVPVREDGHVIMIRQYRHAAGGMIFEIPAGRMEPGEGPADCARRELAEETGQRASRWKGLGWIWTTPGFTDEKIHLFLARRLTPVARSPERDEVIEVLDLPMPRVLRMIRRGEIVDGKTICGIMKAHMWLEGLKNG